MLQCKICKLRISKSNSLMKRQEVSAITTAAGRETKISQGAPGEETGLTVVELAATRTLCTLTPLLWTLSLCQRMPPLPLAMLLLLVGERQLPLVEMWSRFRQRIESSLLLLKAPLRPLKVTVDYALLMISVYATSWSLVPDAARLTTPSASEGNEFPSQSKASKREPIVIVTFPNISRIGFVQIAWKLSQAPVLNFLPLQPILRSHQ